jgi:hypothetical protein
LLLLELLQRDLGQRRRRRRSRSMALLRRLDDVALAACSVGERTQAIEAVATLATTIGGGQASGDASAAFAADAALAVATAKGAEEGGIGNESKLRSRVVFEMAVPGRDVQAACREHANGRSRTSSACRARRSA